MKSISLCMITKNESGYLKQCLDSVKDFVDEIIIVDTGSTDDTKSIAKKYTKNIYDFEWSDDFSSARNFSITKASKDWILILDADEIISFEDMKKIKKLDSDHDSYYFIQRNYTNDSKRSKWVPISKKSKETKNYSGFAINPIIRLFKKNPAVKYQGKVHEVVDKSVKNPKQTDIVIHHYYDEKKENSLEKRQLKYLELAEQTLKEKEDGRAYATAAAVYLYFKKDYDMSRKYFQKAADLGYKKEQCLEGVAESYLNQKKFSKAYDVYKKLAKSGYLTHTLCNNIASILMMHKHHKPALKFLKLALKKGNPNRDRILKNIRALEKKVETK